MERLPKVLTVAAVPLKSIFSVRTTANGTIEVEGGTDARIWDLLSQALRVPYRVVTPPDRSWGDLDENGTWSGALGMVHRKEADLAIGKIAITETRALDLDYSYPYDIETLTFATQLPGLQPKYTAVLWPFSWQLWIGIIVLLVGLTVVFRLLLSQRRSWEKLTLMLLGHLVHQQLGMEVETFRDRILVVAWLMSAMFVSFGYTAVLLAVMSVPQEEKGVRDLYELSSEVCAGRYKCLTFEGDFHTEIFLKSTDPTVQCMGHLIEKNRWKVIPLRDLVGKALSRGKTAVVAPTYFFTRFLQNKVFMPAESLSSLTRSIFYRKDFCCKEKLDRFIHIVTAGGFYHKYLKHQLFLGQFEPEAIESVEEGEVKSLTVVDMACPFMLLVFGLALSTVTCCVEIWSYRRRRSTMPSLDSVCSSRKRVIQHGGRSMWLEHGPNSLKP